MLVVHSLARALPALETNDRRELPERIDRPLSWLYTLLYAVGGAIAVRPFPLLHAMGTDGMLT